MFSLHYFIGRLIELLSLIIIDVFSALVQMYLFIQLTNEITS